MADRHELDRESPRLPGTVEDEDTGAPDCSKCKRFGDLLLYLETGEGPFDVSQEDQEHLRRVLTIAPDLPAFSIAMYRFGVCPFAMLEHESLGAVLRGVPLGSCIQFDDVYRPGIDIGAV